MYLQQQQQFVAEMSVYISTRNDDLHKMIRWWRWRSRRFSFNWLANKLHYHFSIATISARTSHKSRRELVILPRHTLTYVRVHPVSIAYGEYTWTSSLARSSAWNIFKMARRTVNEIPLKVYLSTHESHARQRNHSKICSLFRQFNYKMMIPEIHT